MEIHFICTGNTYRSRLAEAYLKSLKLKKVRVKFSGIKGGSQHMTIRWYTKKILTQQGLTDHASKRPRQTTAANLKSSDLPIFFEPSHFDFASQLLNLKSKK